MKRMFVGLAIGLAMVSRIVSIWAETTSTRAGSSRPREIKWSAGPARSLPAGAESAVLHGDPGSPGVFALRVKMPKGYGIAPHMHVRPEIVTVISGRVSLGLGPAADRAGLEVLPAGSFSSMPHGVVHYVFVDEDAIIQIDAVGPWEIEYVNPKDDRRLDGAPEISKSRLHSLDR